jgi:membrane protease YdiL (CAAX protease family)
LIWSSWHLPLFLIQGWTTSPFWIYAIIVTALSVIITLAYNLSGGSVITAILVHDTFNAGGAPLHDFLGNAILRQHFDLIVACAFLLTAMALTASTRGNLGMKCSAAADEDAA